MDAKKEVESTSALCKSIFKSGDRTTKRDVTNKWIELINILEANKRTKTIERQK